MLFMGVDVGTQGSRIAILDEEGSLILEASCPMQSEGIGLQGQVEQNPLEWIRSVEACLDSVCSRIKSTGYEMKDIAAAAVTSTSGTVLAVDSKGLPLINALMYNDSRAHGEAQEVQAAGGEISDKLGYRFSSSFSLSKILWIKKNRPGIYEKTAKFLHAADFVAGYLMDEYRYSDYSNSLKSGFDLIEGKWPDFIPDKLDLDLNLFPEVKKPGETYGRINGKLARIYGFSPKCTVVGGMTDGCAGVVASGAVSPGEASSTLGTTLVIKGISKSIVKDPMGRVYCHLLPNGYWMPGGASNTGGEALEKKFPGTNLATMDEKVEQFCPSGLVVYPLQRVGERFPFNCPWAEGFVIGSPGSSIELYAGLLEGVGYLERHAYEMMAGLGAPVGDYVYATGGAAKSLQWLRIRANILNKVMKRPLYGQAAVGMAILASSSTHYTSLNEAVKNMVRVETVVEPQRDRPEEYEQKYLAFLEECRRRGYIKE